MKQILAIAALALVVSALHENDGQRHKLKENYDGCLSESGVTKEELKRYQDTSEEDLPEKMLCFVKCMKEKNGMLKDGLVDVEMLRSAPWMNRIEEEKRNAFFDCVAGLEKVETCGDAKGVVACFKPLRKESVEILKDVYN